MRTANVLWLGLLLSACGEPKSDFESKAEAASAMLRTLSTRPLTSADVERYLAIWPRLVAAKGDGGAAKRVLEEEGADLKEWGFIQSRIMLAWTDLAISSRGGKGSKSIRATKEDIDVVRPFRERIDAVMGSK